MPDIIDKRSYLCGLCVTLRNGPLETHNFLRGPRYALRPALACLLQPKLITLPLKKLSLVKYGSHRFTAFIQRGKEPEAGRKSEEEKESQEGRKSKKASESKEESEESSKPEKASESRKSRKPSPNHSF